MWNEGKKKKRNEGSRLVEKEISEMKKGRKGKVN